MDESRLDWQLSKSSLGERFKELYKLKEWTDCTFSVGETKPELIKCHKLILATSSPVFEALFYGPMAEVSKVIHVPDLEPETFKSLLRYIYCDTIELKDILQAGYLLYATKKYMIPHLSRICLDYIVEHTQISNLLDVLDLAESLNEEELFKPCLKVMSRYSFEVWASSDDHVSQVVLSRLLDQDASNMSETELWTFILSWAEIECELKNISPSKVNVRAVIDSAGLLEKIRFLTFTSKDIADLVEPTGVLSCDEVKVLKECIKTVEQCSEHEQDTCVLYSEGDVIVPNGFNRSIRKRARVSTGNSRCSRQILTKRKTWTYGGTVCTKVTSQSHVLVIGFEVFTRIPSTADFCMSRGNTDKYIERLVVKVADDEGVEMSRTNHDHVAEFNASQIVRLNQPVWFSPHRKYTVTFELSPGQYPLSQLSGTASSKIAVFRFEDFTNYPEGYLDFSFISAVMFSL